MTSSLPAKVDVAILGAGLAGLWLAHRLADRADVLLVDDPSPPCASTRRSLGIVAAGQADNPARLRESLGSNASEILWRWSRRACRSLRDLCDELELPAGSGPVLRLALDPQEASELRSSVQLITEWEGESSAVVMEPEVLRRGGLGSEFTLGVAVEGDFVCPLGELEESLARRLDGRLTRIAAAARLGGTSLDGVSVILGDQTCRAELVVACGGAASSSIHPWFEAAVLPVRIHATRSTPVFHSSRGELQRGAGLSRHRFESWVWGSEGGLDFAGCRWAEGPDMGAGVTDDENLNEKVSAAHDAFIHQHLGVAAGSLASSQRGGITAYSCDGLPLVGPLPGAPRLLAMTAWGGWGLSAIGAAVEDLATAILDETAPQSPRELLSPRRML